ncbi:MAG: type IX secretion system sortase PorU, partial [Bacteroidota bacterium]
MIKKTLLTLISVFFIWSVYGQQKKVIERHIDWQGLRTFKDKRKNQQTIFYLDFKHAAFLNQPSMWPWYQEKLNVQSFNTKAHVFDLQYKKVPDEWASKISNADELPEEISFDKVNVYGINKKPVLDIFFLPLRYNKSADQLEMVVSFKVEVQTLPQLKESSMKSFQNASLLKSGSWRKIKVSETGVYRLSYDQILSMGYDNPENFRIFGFGGMLPQQNSEDFYDDLPEVPVYFKKGNDGIFNSGDYVFFFLKGPDDYSYLSDKEIFEVNKHLYSDFSFYFITCDKGPAQNLIETKNQGSLNPTDTVRRFDDFRHHEEDKVNLIRSGKDFFEPVDLYESYSFAFNFPNLVHTEPVKISARVAGRSDELSDFVFKSGGSAVLALTTSAVSFSGSNYTYATVKSGLDSFFITSDKFNVDVSFPSTRPGAEGYLDYITLTARRDLKMDDYQMMFRDYHSVGAGEERTFRIENTSSDYIVWNVSDPHQIFSMPANHYNGRLLFNASTEDKEDYVVFNSKAGVSAPVYKNASGVGALDNQDIHSQGPVDYVIVTHSKFLSQAERLADLHREQGLSVLVVENEQVYNEYSSGTPDITAIKNMMRMFYSRYTSPDERIKYLLLFGNGSYNNKDQFKENSNYILTYQSDNSVSKTSSFVSDDYYGLLDDSEGASSGFVDIGIGRFPVETVSQAKVLVDKVETYMSDEAMGDWRNIVSFIGDDEDNALHMEQSDELSDTVTKRAPAFNIEKIFLDAYKQVSMPSGERYPDVEDAINNRFDKGALIINYTGHGGENGLTHERVIDINSIKSWNNHPRYPMFITASCEFSRYDDYKRTTAGEYTILNNKGGVIALLTTTRLVYAGPNFVLNLEFFRHVFERDSLGNVLRMGDVMARTKQNVAHSTNKRNFSLLGDPALQIAIPEKDVLTTELNDQDVTIQTDTLKALSKVNVKGVLKD